MPELIKYCQNHPDFNFIRKYLGRAIEYKSKMYLIEAIHIDAILNSQNRWKITIKLALYGGLFPYQTADSEILDEFVCQN